jgi:hypothetical protein
VKRFSFLFVNYGKGGIIMKKNLMFAALMLTMGGALAACGTAEPSSGATNGSTDEPVEETAIENTTEETAGDKTTETETANEDTASDEAASGETATDEATDEEAAGEETASGDATSDEAVEPAAAEGTLTQSDEQPYELNVLSGYELTSEEPGKDSLYLADDSSVFMRIETFAPGEVDFSQAETQLKETLEAVNPEAEIAEGPALKAAEFINSSSYEIPSVEGTVTGIVFEKENQLVRLTVFDNSSAGATDDFIAMGKTIERTE